MAQRERERERWRETFGASRAMERGILESEVKRRLLWRNPKVQSSFKIKKHHAILDLKLNVNCSKFEFEPSNLRKKFFFFFLIIIINKKPTNQL